MSNPMIDMEKIRMQLTAVQSAFDDEKTLVIEVVHNDVRVYIKRGFGRQRIDTGNGFEANILRASHIARDDEPAQARE